MNRFREIQPKVLFQRGEKTTNEETSQTMTKLADIRVCLKHYFVTETENRCKVKLDRDRCINNQLSIRICGLPRRVRSYQVA